MPVPRVPPEWPLERRLAERSVRDPKTGCLLWTASRNRSGYGHLFWKGVPQLAHRAAWMARHGPIPKGLYVCHRCDVRPCINPDHLFLGTQKDNMIDKALKMGHGRRIEGVPECRPHKAPEIMWVRIGDEEIVARVLDVRRAAGAASRPGCGPNPGSMLALRPGAKRRVKSGRSGEDRSPC